MSTRAEVVEGGAKVSPIIPTRRSSQNWKGGSGKWGGIEVYTVECYLFYYLLGL